MFIRFNKIYSGARWLATSDAERARATPDLAFKKTLQSQIHSIMKISVNLSSSWTPCKNSQYKYAKAVYLDLDSCSKVYGIVVAKADCSVESPQNSVPVVLRQWGYEEYNGRKNLKFMGAL